MLTVVSSGEGTTTSEIRGTILLFISYSFILGEFFLSYVIFVLIYMLLDKILNRKKCQMIYASLWFIKSIYYLTAFRVPQEGGNWTFGELLSFWLSAYILQDLYCSFSLFCWADCKCHTPFPLQWKFCSADKRKLNF